MIVIVIVLAISFFAGAFLAGLCAVLSAGDETERELDDAEQAEYLWNWKKSKGSRLSILPDKPDAHLSNNPNLIFLRKRRGLSRALE